jgi:hypothetical protein
MGAIRILTIAVCNFNLIRIQLTFNSISSFPDPYFV